MTWRPPLSIRARLTIWYSLVLLFVLFLYAGGVYIFVRRQLLAELDAHLLADFATEARSLERTASGGLRFRRILSAPGSVPVLPNHAVEAWSFDGRLLASLDLPPLFVTRKRFPPPTRMKERIVSMLSSDGVRFRVLTRAFGLLGQPVFMRIFVAEERLRSRLERLARVLLLGLPFAVAVAAVGGYAIARRSLAQVAQMTERARKISASFLDERLPVQNPKDEIGTLAETLNEMIARLQNAFRALKSFTSDASHEFRTPLTALKSVGEVALQKGSTEEECREAIGSMLEEADRIGKLLAALLTLARVEGGSAPVDRVPVDLTVLAREVVEYLGVLAEDKEQEVSAEGPDGVMASGDRLTLRQVLVNLVDNAIKYSPEGGSIRVKVWWDGAGPAVDVIDSGPGIAPEEQARVFERFYRIDTDRSREGGGFGLGLAIARSIVEAQGGRLSVSSRQGEGSTFRLRLEAVAGGPVSA